jgi:hypothetical protein
MGNHYHKFIRNLKACKEEDLPEEVRERRERVREALQEFVEETTKR